MVFLRQRNITTTFNSVLNRFFCEERKVFKPEKLYSGKHSQPAPVSRKIEIAIQIVCQLQF